MPNTVKVLPEDTYNKQLIANVHPGDWINPIPAPVYNMVVIGAGTAGLVTAMGAAGLGAKVALVEKSLMGGDCLNVGCVPSKAVIRAAKAVAHATSADEFGVDCKEIEISFEKAMERMRKVRASISNHDSVKRFSNAGVDVFLGEAKFTSENTIEVDGKSLKFKKATIATGGRPSVPLIDGIENVGYLTNETVFELETLPKRIAVIGGGPIGCELAQAFRRFGAEVTIFQRGSQFLSKEDPDAARIVEHQFKIEGVAVVLNSKVMAVCRTDADVEITYKTNIEEPQKLVVDEIILATGRDPNIENLGLDVAGIESNSKGIVVNDRLQTTNKRVYACGDVCMKHKFTHAADFAARAVIQNALFFGRKKVSDLLIPWCTYTEPEIAHVGSYKSDARQQGIEIDTYTKKFSEVDRAILDAETDGFVTVHVKSGSDKIVGATIVGSHAGDMISELTLAISQGIGLSKIASVIHPYPTQAEAIRQIGDLYNKTRLTPRIKKLFNLILKLSRI